MSGYDVCARIKSDPATRSLPIIILTAADNESFDAFGFHSLMLRSPCALRID